MYALQKCTKCIWCCCVFCTAKNKGSAKIYLMQKCIFAEQSNAVQKCIWCKNAFLRTFSFGKCSASHFPKENVQQNKMLQMHLMQKCIWCCPYILLVQKCIFANQNVRKRQNAFDAKMHFCNAYIFQRKMFSVHFPKENVQLCKNAVFFALQKTKMRTFCWCKNAFDAKMLCFLLCKKQRCYPYILLVQKCIFANQNVRKRQNAFWRTFSKGKCSAYILRSKMFSITYCFAKMHLMRTFCFAKMHFCINKKLQMHFGNATQNKMYASNAFVTFCFAEHFTKSNVMLNIFLCKMYAKMHL